MADKHEELTLTIVETLKAAHDAMLRLQERIDRLEGIAEHHDSVITDLLERIEELETPTEE